MLSETTSDWAYVNLRRTFEDAVEYCKNVYDGELLYPENEFDTFYKFACTFSSYDCRKIQLRRLGNNDNGNSNKEQELNLWGGAILDSNENYKIYSGDQLQDDVCLFKFWFFFFLNLT